MSRILPSGGLIWNFKRS